MQEASLADELLRIMDENPHSLHDDQISATLRGEMAVMRLLGGQGTPCQLAAGEISRKLSMTTSRIAAVLNLSLIHILLRAIAGDKRIGRYAAVSGRITLTSRAAYLPQELPEEARPLSAYAFFCESSSFFDPTPRELGAVYKRQGQRHDDGV